MDKKILIVEDIEMGKTVAAEMSKNGERGIVIVGADNFIPQQDPTYLKITPIEPAPPFVEFKERKNYIDGSRKLPRKKRR